MTAIPDDKLFEHADRLKDKVVIITGWYPLHSCAVTTINIHFRGCKRNRKRNGNTLCLVWVSNVSRTSLLLS